jgi:hypothetical protein
MTGEFEGFLTAALRDLSTGGLDLSSVRTVMGVIGPDGNVIPTTTTLPVNVVKLSAQVPISHDALCDYTDHVCTADCPPPFVAPPVPLRRRVRYALRRSWWWLTGLRVAHKSRIDQGEEDE